MKKRILCFLCIVMLFASVFGAAAMATDISSTAADHVKQKIYEAVSAGEESVIFTKDEMGDDWVNTALLIEDAMNDLTCSCPEVSWKLDSEWEYTIGTDDTVTLPLPYLADDEGLRRMQAEIEAQTEPVLLVMNEQDNLFDKLLVLHDYLCAHIEYGSGEYDQGIYGALVEGRCVCAGYANALSYFLDLMDLENSVVVGTAVNSAGEEETHAWNCIVVNDTDYYMDLTWDDTDEIVNGAELIMYNYFMVSADSLSEHTPDDSADMPATGAGEGELNYYVHEGSYLTAYSREAVKSVIAVQAGEGKTIFTFCFSHREAEQQAEAELIENGELSRILSELDCTGSYMWYTSGAEEPEICGWAVVLETDSNLREG